MASSRRAAPLLSPHMRRLPPLSHRHLTPQVVLGLYIVRGDNMCAMPPPHSRLGLPARARARAVVGEVDEEVDAELDLNGMMAEPLKPVVH